MTGRIGIIGADGEVIMIPLTNEQTATLKANFSQFKPLPAHSIMLNAVFVYGLDEEGKNVGCCGRPHECQLVDCMCRRAMTIGSDTDG